MSSTPPILPCTVIPTRLRHALRLIHCLQKERGASSSLYAFQVSHANSINNANSKNHSANQVTAPPSGIGASLLSLSEQNSNNTDLAGTGISVDFLQTTVRKTRESTDAAFVVFLSSLNLITNPSEIIPSRPWEEALTRVRACVDLAGGGGTTIHSKSTSTTYTNTHNSTASTTPEEYGSHRVVVMFNILIGNIIDESVIQLVKKQQRQFERVTSKKNIRYGENNAMSRSTSSHHFDRNDEYDHHQMSTTVPSRIASSLPMFCNDSPPSHTHTRIPPMDFSSMDTRKRFEAGNFSPPTGFGAGNHQNDGNVLISGNGHTHEQHQHELQHYADSYRNNDRKNNAEYEYKIPISSIDSPGSFNKSLVMIEGEDSDRTKLRTRNLMSLLLSFVRLKESIGLDRAILSNLMAVDVDKYHSSSSKLLAGLVVEDANQRMIVQELRSQTKRALELNDLGDNSMKGLLIMMEDMLKPGKEMEVLQDMIRTSFNLHEFRKAMPLTRFWDIITIYIDKLHSMELLLVEELQTTLAHLQLLQPPEVLALGETKQANSQKSLVSLYTAVNTSGDLNRDNRFLYQILLSKKKENIDELTDEEALRAIMKLPAEEIKRSLMSHLRDEIYEPVHHTEESLIKQHSLPTAEIPHSLKEWEIDLYEIEFRKRIGRGVGGTTYLAKWSGQNVAVKVAAITDLGLEGWHTEVNSLRRLHHPNVIRLLGSIFNPSPQTYGLVLEYCESGDLSLALQRSTPSNFFWRVADDVANGMSYLHRKNILHRDIKPGNVLLNGDVQGGNFTAKLSDFGVAIMHNSAYDEEHTAETGTYRWMAPEIIRHEAYSFMADVYSYALVVWQLVTHEIPFKPFSQIEAAGKVAVDDARPPFPRQTPEFIIALIETCWQENQEDRLSFAQITIELKEIHKVLSDGDKVWLGAEYGHPVYDKPKERQGRPGTASEQKRRTPLHRSKSPNRSGKQGGLFSIFNPNKNR